MKRYVLIFIISFVSVLVNAQSGNVWRFAHWNTKFGGVGIKSPALIACDDSCSTTHCKYVYLLLKDASSIQSLSTSVIKRVPAATSGGGSFNITREYSQSDSLLVLDTVPKYRLDSSYYYLTQVDDYTMVIHSRNNTKHDTIFFESTASTPDTTLWKLNINGDITPKDTTNSLSLKADMRVVSSNTLLGIINNPRINDTIIKNPYMTSIGATDGYVGLRVNNSQWSEHGYTSIRLDTIHGIDLKCGNNGMSFDDSTIRFGKDIFAPNIPYKVKLISITQDTSIQLQAGEEIRSFVIKNHIATNDTIRVGTSALDSSIANVVNPASSITQAHQKFKDFDYVSESPQTIYISSTAWTENTFYILIEKVIW